MPSTIQPVGRFKCTYSNCAQFFSTEKAMKSHKKNSDDHDYCHKCDEDFDSTEDLDQHKAFRPDNHGKACRVCGSEFKSTSGLKLHIELSHKVEQKLECIGCKQNFYRASFLIQHLEFGHCPQIDASDFQGHIVHKHLITELLKGGPAYDRFIQKVARYDAAIDTDTKEGGVEILDPFDQDTEGAQQVEYPAIEPEQGPKTSSARSSSPFPSLPSLGSKLTALTIRGVTSRPDSVHSEGASAQSSIRTPRAWGSRNDKTSSSILFPDAKPTPVTSEYSISNHDDTMEQQHGVNIMRVRFWDPMSKDWNPERFFDVIIEKYYCPFVCEQTFMTAADLSNHILHHHRIIRMKCPRCFKYFKCCTALISHCENGSGSCQIKKMENFNILLDRLTGGFLGVEEEIRPDHIENPEVIVRDPQTGSMQRYLPPVVSYLRYSVTKPPDWNEPETRRGRQ